ncbi:hypothetical protein NOCA2300007 [metagenome]|uniref:Uncharacterized protein n=1 Tax=metagenome TaxID=256318 RepID=A0A2P2C187_9ZZZZ
MQNDSKGPSETDPSSPVDDEQAPWGAAARTLELAALTADRLVAEAKEEAESLLLDAKTSAHAIVEASRREADQVTAELARTKEAQAAELDRERSTALAGLSDEKSALEKQVDTLRQLENRHRSHLRNHLTEQLSLLDTTLPGPPTAT